MKILAIIALLGLFFIISKSADLIVINLRKTGEKLGIKIFILGIILGIMTSLPEMAIGINSAINKVSIISFGNLIGGIIVLFALILPISIMLNRKIQTEEKSWPFLITLLFLILPIILGFKGQLNYIDGIILMSGYLLLVYYLYKKNRERNWIKIELVNRRELSRHLFSIIIGMVGLIISSQLIIKTTLFLFQDYNVSAFIVGLLFYAIGTNLPELIITIRSFKRNVSELSLSNLMGSAMGNVLMLGILSFARAIDIQINTSYIFLAVFTLILFILLAIFYKTNRLLSRREGLVLLLLYLFFVGSQIYLQIN
jgi:cation:H+ antiporter